MDIGFAIWISLLQSDTIVRIVNTMTAVNSTKYSNNTITSFPTRINCTYRFFVINKFVTLLGNNSKPLMVQKNFKIHIKITPKILTLRRITAVHKVVYKLFNFSLQNINFQLTPSPTLLLPIATTSFSFIPSENDSLCIKLFIYK